MSDKTDSHSFPTRPSSHIPPPQSPSSFPADNPGDGSRVLTLPKRGAPHRSQRIFITNLRRQPHINFTESDRVSGVTHAIACASAVPRLTRTHKNINPGAFFRPAARTASELNRPTRGILIDYTARRRSRATRAAKKKNKDRDRGSLGHERETPRTRREKET